MKAARAGAFHDELLVAFRERIDQHAAPPHAFENVGPGILAAVVCAHLDEISFARVIERLEDQQAFLEIRRFEMRFALGQQCFQVVGRIHFRFSKG